MKVIILSFLKIADMIRRRAFVFVVLLCNVILFGFMSTYFYTNIREFFIESNSESIYIDNVSALPIKIDDEMLNTLDVRFYRFAAGGKDIVAISEDEILSGTIPERIRFIIPGDISDTKKALYEQQIYRAFSDGYEIMVDSLGTNEYAELVGLIRYVAILFFLSVMGLTYQICYFLTDYARELNIYEILGASRGYTFKLMIITFGSIIAFGIVISQVIYYVLAEQISKINLLNVEFSKNDIILVTTISIIIMIIMTVLILKVSLRNSMIEAKNRLEC